MHYQRLLRFLKNAAKDATEFMAGSHLPFPEVAIKDEVLSVLLKPQTIDARVQQLLQSVFTTLELLVLRMLDDHLEHGKWETLQTTEANKRGETESVRTTNVVSERDCPT